MKKIVIDNSDLSQLDKENIVNELNTSDKYSIEVLYRSDFSNTSILRNFVSFLCDNLWIDPTWKFKIVLISDELNNNAIEYWSAHGEENKMRIFVTKRWKICDFVVEVEDTWKWLYHKSAKEMYKLREDKIAKWFKDYSSIRWRWLFLIIENLVDELYFKDSSWWWLVVWIDFKDFKINKE